MKSKIKLLNITYFEFNKCRVIVSEKKNKKKTHQITHCVIIIMASLSAEKKSCNGFPFSCILPIVAPNTILNITIPKTFVVCENSDLNFHSDGLTVNERNRNYLTLFIR